MLTAEPCCNNLDSDLLGATLLVNRGREAINGIYNIYLKTLHYVLEINC